MAKKFFGLFQSEINPIRVIDRSGNIRLQIRDGGLPGQHTIGIRTRD